MAGDEADAGAPELDRRAFLGVAAAGAATGLAGVPAVAGARPKRKGKRRPKPPPIGAGGKPMQLGELVALARVEGKGYPILFLDLAALDQNMRVVTAFANGQGWGVRPALKTFRSPDLIAYILQRLPRPLGLVFNLDEVDPIMAVAPRGTDLMCGYPPTFGELRAFLAARPPRKQRRHRLRFLVDSVPLLEELAAAARTTRRRLPLDVALEFDVGMGKGGIGDARELEACTDILRRERSRLRLGAVLGYDGHATLMGEPAYRKLIALQAISAYRDRLHSLESLAPDLYDAKTLIRNGPGSSNYRNWAGGPVNEISTGSAFVCAGYLEDGYDTAGLAAALTAGGAVRRITSDWPSVPITQTTLPGSTHQEVVVQGILTAEEVASPEGVRVDEASGGGDALVVPKGSVALGQYVLFRPHQAEVAMLKFEHVTAVRGGRVLRRWAIQPRPGRAGLVL